MQWCGAPEPRGGGEGVRMHDASHTIGALGETGSQTVLAQRGGLVVASNCDCFRRLGLAFGRFFAGLASR